MANEHPSGDDMPRTDQEWRQRLDPQQYAVCRCSATEAPFTGKYWDHHGIGTYACVACGAPLFASGDKFDSGTGWPSYARPRDADAVSQHADDSHGMRRTEVRSRAGDSHLGHVFTGDRESPNGVRYCINSASLRFIPYEKMEQEGYGELMSLFE